MVHKIIDYIAVIEYPDLKTSELLALCRKRFRTAPGNDTALDIHFLRPKIITKRSFLSQGKPDAQTLGFAVDQAEEEGFINGITFRERILLELEYFDRTGLHLDIETITLCSGSRIFGFVPCVGWGELGFGFSSEHSRVACSVYGIRSGV